MRGTSHFNSGGFEHPHLHHHDGDARGRGDRPGRGRGGGRRGGFGPGGAGFGPGGFGRGFGPGFGAGRARNGDVRNAVLSVLSQGPNSGYGIIKAIAVNSSGSWRVSPGSVYPTLNALDTEELVTSTGSGRRSEYTLTEPGERYVAEHQEQIEAVWERQAAETEEHAELGESIGKLMGAIRQIAMEAQPELSGKVSTILDDARRSIYKLLAE